MAKVNVRKETGRLVIDFTFRGVRCREQTALGDTPANRMRVESVLKTLREAISAGTFVYSDFFPGSALAARFEVHQTTSTGGVSSSADDGVAAASAALETPTFAGYAATWFRNHEVEWRRSHIKVLRSTVDGHLVPYFGDTPVGGVTKARVLAFRNHLASLPGRGGKPGLSNKRINGILAPLRQVLAEAAEEFGFVSPMANVKPLRVRKTDIEPFTLDQVQTLLNTARPDYRDYFVVRFFTGMRTGEVHGLKWKYIDFANRLIFVREAFVLGEDEYTKTDGSQRDIQMTQVVYEALMRQQQATGKLSEYVFSNREGKPLDNKNFTDRVWSPLLRHLGLTRRRPYQMRHTAATLWLAAGEAPEWIARQLGHTTTEMLFRTYSRFVPNLTRRDGSAFERLLATRFASGQNQEAPPSAATSRPAAANDASDGKPQGQGPPAGRARALMRAA